MSVVIPTRDRATLLPRAVESVLAQTIDDYEIIIADDGSTDGTAALSSRWDDPRVRWITMAEPLGGGGTRNAAIRIARGEFIAFLDDDDAWLPTKLGRQLERAREVGAAADVIYCSRSIERPGTEPGWDTHPTYEGDVFDRLLSGWWIPTSALMIRRSVLAEVGGFAEDLPSFQDYDLLLRLAGSSHGFFAVSERLLVYYEHPGQRISTDPEKRLAGFKLVRERWGPIVRSRQGLMTYRRWVAFQTLAARFAAIGEAAERGERAGALRHCLAIASCVPHEGSTRVLASALPLALLGRDTYDRLRRSWRKARGGAGEREATLR